MKKKNIVAKLALFTSLVFPGSIYAQGQLRIEDEHGNDLSSQAYLTSLGSIFGEIQETYYIRNVGDAPVTDLQAIISEDSSYGFSGYFSFSSGNNAPLEVGAVRGYNILYDTLSGLEGGAKLSFTGGAETLLEIPIFSRTEIEGRDIGNPTQPGSTTVVAIDQYTLTAGGSYLGLGIDQYHFASPAYPLGGDNQIQVRVDSVEDTSFSSRGGVMIRDVAGGGSQTEQSFVYIWMQPDNRVSMQYRDGNQHQFLVTANGDFLAGDEVNPKWVKLTRNGDTFTGYYSIDGQDWQTFASVDVVMDPSAAPGLAVNASTFDNSSTTKAHFSELSIRDLDSGDIGNTNVAGSTNFSDGVYTLKGSGQDIWGVEDKFQYRSEKFLGDGEVVARVDSLVRRHFWTKAGVMLRDSFAANAANVSVFMRPDKKVVMQVRRTNGALTENITGSATATGDTSNFKWLKITREGNIYTGFYSIDGESWTQINSVELDLAVHCEAGLALTSHSANKLSTAKFSEFSVNEYSESIEAYWELDQFTTHTGDESENRHQLGVHNVTSVAGVNGDAFNFSGTNSYLSIPKETFNVIQNEMSLSMWVKGGADQARADSVFYATDEQGNRVINIHLPWKNSRVYWDCGVNQSSVDRIDKKAQASQFKNDWNHWVFTKNANTGKMAIYVNGALWHSGTGKTGTIKNIAEATISAGPNSGINSYSGSIDSVQIYRVELTAEEITELYNSY